MPLRPRRTSQPMGRLSASWTIAIGNAVMAFLYSNPAVLVRRPNPAIRSRSVVAYIEQLGPIWVSAFGVASFALVLSLLFQRYLSLAHSISSAVWAGYFMAVLWTALTNAPRGPYLTASISAVVAILNFTLVIAYVDYRDRE